MSVEIKKRIITSFFLITLLFLMFYYSYVLIISIIFLAIIAWIEFYALISKIFKKNDFNGKLFRFFAKATSLFYLMLIVFLIFTHLELKFHIFFLLAISICSDIGGLVVGKLFKGKKLSKISPNKTISGSIGGLLLSLILIPFFYSHLDFNNLYLLSVFTIIISMTSQFGDLFISLLKRKAKVKNTSDLLPGHGGILDRIDGMIFATPVGIILLNIFII
ncbi:phosphatidate cytidylyltransferase [Candidatus Pelagibacter sp. Uisw_092]|uniref:phosphatidate cytidylyltransferase n=1 Tax=Candidatus Pelagibacter sp. Uisw_092 TaxID=3230979 RepID=UPI0039EB868C